MLKSEAQISVTCFGSLPAIINSCGCSSRGGAEAVGEQKRAEKPQLGQGLGSRRGRAGHPVWTCLGESGGAAGACRHRGELPWAGVTVPTPGGLGKLTPDGGWAGGSGGLAVDADAWRRAWPFHFCCGCRGERPGAARCPCVPRCQAEAVTQSGAAGLSVRAAGWDRHRAAWGRGSPRRGPGSRSGGSAAAEALYLCN